MDITTDPAVLEIRGELLAWRRLTERYLYTGVKLDADMTLKLFDTLVRADQMIGQLDEAQAGMTADLAQMEEVARDLDLIGRDCKSAPRLVAVPMTAPPAPAKVVPFPRLPPRPLFEPAGPGGVA